MREVQSEEVIERGHRERHECGTEGQPATLGHLHRRLSVRCRPDGGAWTLIWRLRGVRGQPVAPCCDASAAEGVELPNARGSRPPPQRMAT